MRFWISTLLTAAVPIYLRWAHARVEAQIDKMQEAVFSSPGAEAPVPPVVLLACAGIVSAHWWLGHRLGLGNGRSSFSLLLGGLVGLVLSYLLRSHATL